MPDDARPELLEALRTIEQGVWASDTPASLRARDDAARAALEGGWTAEELARELKVEPDDILRWAAVRP